MSKDRNHQIFSCRPLENCATNCDPESVCGGHRKGECGWPTLCWLGIPPLFYQCLDMVYGYPCVNFTLPTLDLVYLVCLHTF
jgi:hypothetical protein